MVNCPYKTALYNYEMVTFYCSLLYICAYVCTYLESFLVPGCLFFLTIRTITINDIKPIITAAMTVPNIIGSGVELVEDEDDEPDKVGGSITIRITYIQCTYVRMM